MFVVIVSLPCNLIYRKKNRYFTDPRGLSVELVCFNLLIIILMTLTLTVFGIGKYIGEGVLTAIFVTLNLYFLIRAARTFL